MDVDLKFLVRDTDRHGNRRLYFRHGGHKVRLREAPGTAAFAARYHALLAIVEAGQPLRAPPAPGTGPARPGTWRALCIRYFAAPAFRRLDARTQRVRRGVIEQTFLEVEKPGSPRVFADMPIAAFGARAVRVLRDRKAETPEAANVRLKAIRRVFAWAIEEGEPGVRANPARDVGYIRTGSGGHHSWTEAEVATFEARWPPGTPQHRALIVMLLTGARRADAAGLGRQHLYTAVDGTTWLRWRQFKGRRKASTPTVDIPVLPELAAALATVPAGQLPFIASARGAPYTAESFGNWFSQAARDAGLDRCTAHGLRKAGAARAAENGATEQQLMAMFGWLTPREAARYTAAARRKLMAGAGMHTMARAGESVPPATTITVPPAAGD